MALLASAGCATQQTTLRTTYDPQETARLLEPGNNTIKGSALMRQLNGGTITCAGREVHLSPVTSYSAERMLVIYKSAHRGYKRILVRSDRSPFTNENDEYLRSARVKTCDAQGFFKFENVADGKFFINTAVQWQINPYFLEGGVLMQQVAVTGGEIKEIVLAP